MRNKDIFHLQRKIDHIYLSDWEYFTSDKILTQNDKVREYQGLDLPRKILRKVYHDNAIKMYSGLGER